jgi:hypothetical protein
VSHSSCANRSACRARQSPTEALLRPWP